MHRIRPTGLIRPPPYRRFQAKDKPKVKHWLFERKQSPAESEDNHLLCDYYRIADYVKQLPTIKEKIDFVNPHERPWRKWEKTWHRPWHPELFEPRQAWAIPTESVFFDALNFYKYITNSRVLSREEGRARLDDYYKTTNSSSNKAIKKFEERLSENLVCLLTSKGTFDDLLPIALRNMFEELLACSSTDNSCANSLRISHTPRCESFWIRAGFKNLYQNHNVNYDEIEQSDDCFTGDDRRLLGELSFTMRDKLISQTRCVEPIRNLFDWSDTNELYASVFDESIDLENDVLFDPKIYRLEADPGILWQCPGYDYDIEETHKFGSLALKDSSNLPKLLDYWKPDSFNEREEIYHDFYASTALISLFNWLNGQAHCTGNTQFTDIERPLTSQLIVADGKDFCFAVSQLNTIAINRQVDGFVNKHTNLCCVDGPHKLYDVFDDSNNIFKYYVVDDKGEQRLVDGFNPHVVKRLFQMCNNY